MLSLSPPRTHRDFPSSQPVPTQPPLLKSLAGAKMQMIHELKERMKTSVVEFYFIKRDGTLRHAYGTTMPSLAAKHINGRGIPRESVNTTPFFCVETGNWRSLRYESIVKVC